jgi:hypothetical protein
MGQGNKPVYITKSQEITNMSNSSRIEVATRQHVGAVLTNDQLVELVKVSFPDWKGGVYPSDAAGQRQEDGTITHRGKTMYGDLILEYVNKNSFKVLATDKIVRRPVSAKKAAVVAVAAQEKKEVAPAPVKPEPKAVKATKKQAAKASSMPVAPKRATRDAHA